MVVHELIDNGVPLKAIRDAIVKLRDTYGDWPLTHAQLAVPHGFNRAPLIVIEGGEGFDVRRGWQRLLTMDNLHRIASDLARGGWAVRDRPYLEHIEVNPDRLSGRPTIRGLRVPADLVGQLASHPDGLATLKRDYELSDAQIKDAKTWWDAVIEFDKAA